MSAFPFDIVKPVASACAAAPEVANARLTYAYGTMFRPGLLLVEAPDADDERLAAIEQEIKSCLGRYADHVPVICARSAPEPYGRQGATFLFVRERQPA